MFVQWGQEVSLHNLVPSHACISSSLKKKKISLTACLPSFIIKISPSAGAWVSPPHDFHTSPRISRAGFVALWLKFHHTRFIRYQFTVGHLSWPPLLASVLISFVGVASCSEKCFLFVSLPAILPNNLYPSQGTIFWISNRHDCNVPNSACFGTGYLCRTS